MILIKGQRARGGLQYYAVLFKGDTPVLIAYHPEYCRLTFAGGIEAASTRAVETPVSICDVVCGCIKIIMRMTMLMCVRLSIKYIVMS